jgi:hypothetical protein
MRVFVVASKKLIVGDHCATDGKRKKAVSSDKWTVILAIHTWRAG